MKKVISLLLVAVISISMLTFSVDAASTDYSYNPILSKLGISKEAFEAMPPEKKEIYQSVISVEDVFSDTKYFKEEYYIDETGICLPKLVEVTQAEYNIGISNIDKEVAVPYATSATSSGSWYKMTTLVRKSQLSNYKVDTYYVENKIKLDQDNMGNINRNRTGYIGVSLNNNTSTVSGSELCTITWNPIVDPSRELKDYIMTMPYQGFGGAYDIFINNLCKNYEITMGFYVTPNTSTLKVIDAYGFAGYWNETLTPSISVSANGVGIGISPSSGLTKASQTHAQYFI